MECGNCGKQIEDFAKFCGYCGKLVGKNLQEGTIIANNDNKITEKKSHRDIENNQSHSHKKNKLRTLIVSIFIAIFVICIAGWYYIQKQPITNLQKAKLEAEKKPRIVIEKTRQDSITIQKDKDAYNKARNINTKEAYNEYIIKNNNGKFITQAYVEINKLEDSKKQKENLDSLGIENSTNNFSSNADKFDYRLSAIREDSMLRLPDPNHFNPQINNFIKLIAWVEVVDENVNDIPTKKIFTTSENLRGVVQIKYKTTGSLTSGSTLPVKIVALLYGPEGRLNNFSIFYNWEIAKNIELWNIFGSGGQHYSYWKPNPKWISGKYSLILLLNDSEINTFDFEMKKDEITSTHPYSKLTTDLVSYWKIDESSGTTVYDSHGSNNCTVHSGVTINQKGSIGQAAYFIETSGGLTTGKKASQLGIGGNSSKSVSIWIKPSNEIHGPNSNGIIDFGSNGNQKQFGIKFYGSVASAYWMFDSWYGAVQIGSNGNKLADGNWHHIVVTYNSDGHIIKTYLDGNFIIGDASKILNTGDDNGFSIGIGSQGKFIGLIDEVGLWSRALSDNEVKIIYNHGKGIQYPF